MIVTFLIEMALFLAIFFTKKLNTTTKLICVSLLALAFFQLAEYFVCGGFGVNAMLWSRLGFIAITTLPPLGLHIMYSIVSKKSSLLVPISYAVMFAWIVLFGFTDHAFSSHACVSNYVIFNLKDGIGYAYSAYYYGILLLGILKAMKLGDMAKNAKHKKALYGMIIGYLVFLIPTAIANTINPETMAGIPSIMCGFAVLFALILYFYIVPLVSKNK